MVNDTREAARDQAVTQLKKRRSFYAHLLVYVLVNAFLVVIWAITNRHGFFWPIFPIAGWGIAIVLSAWDVYGQHPITEADIQREIEREDKQV